MSILSIDAFTNVLLNVLFNAMANVTISIMHNDARDTVWELKGSTLYSLGTGGEHVMS